MYNLPGKTCGKLKKKEKSSQLHHQLHNRNMYAPTPILGQKQKIPLFPVALLTLNFFRDF